MANEQRDKHGMYATCLNCYLDLLFPDEHATQVLPAHSADMFLNANVQITTQLNWDTSNVNNMEG